MEYSGEEYITEEGRYSMYRYCQDDFRYRDRNLRSIGWYRSREPWNNGWYRSRNLDWYRDRGRFNNGWCRKAWW
jgi:hypothetical protein